MAEPGAVGGALDQPGDVGDGELARVRPVDDAEHGLERRERVVGDLRLRVRDPPQKRRLAGVGQPRERRVDDELQAQLEIELVAGQAGLREARRLPRRRREPRVAASSLPAARGDEAAVRPSSGRRRAARRRPAAAYRRVRGPPRRSPSAPCFLLPRPLPPRPALTYLIRLKAERSRRLGSTTTTTSPPRPPSPPSGPPFGTYFSRRKLRPPSPPRPASAWMCARSWNIAPPSQRGRGKPRPYCRGDRDEALVAGAAELDGSVAEREDRVVATEAGARAGAELRAALADDDHARLHGLAGEDLDAESLRLRVATVPRGAETLLVCHQESPSFAASADSIAAIAPLRFACACSYSSAASSIGRFQPDDAVLDLGDGHVLVPGGHALDALVRSSDGAVRLLGGFSAFGFAAARDGLPPPIDSIWICVSDARKPV